MKKILSLFFTLIFTIFLIPHSVMASEMTEVETRSTVTIKANVPDDFTENIAFVLEQETTQVRFSFALTAENGYTGSISVVGNNTYLASATFSNNEKYNIDLAEKYDIEGEEVELTFNVSPITYSVENDNAVNNNDNKKINIETEAPHGEEIDPDTGLPTAEYVIKNYEDKVSFMQDDKKFFSFLTTYSGAMFEKYYLEADPMNTEEQWESMKEIDRFNYYITYYMPYTKMMNYEFSSANKLIEELIAQKNILSQIENGDIVYDAIVEVWKWHYSYWQCTGTIYNFYNYYDGTNAGTPTVSETVKLTDKDKEEMAEIESEINEELEIETEKDNAVVTWLKENWLTATIFVIVGFAFLGVYLYNRKKNVYDENDK